MKHELTPAQVEYLFSFCRKHFVPYYDLQIELVDHLAHAIEQLMDEQPQFGFEETLAIVYRKFGATGFRQIVREKESALEKEQKKWYFRILKDCFSIPKIMVSIGVVALLFFFYRRYQQEAAVLANTVFVISVMMIFSSLLTTIYVLKYNAKPKKKLISAVIRFPFYFSGIFTYTAMTVLFDYFDGSYLVEKMDYRFLIISVFMWMGILMNTINIELSTQVYQRAKSKYPEAYI